MELRLEGPAPAIGGRLAGSVSVPREAMQASTLHLQLTCLRNSYMNQQGRWVPVEPEPYWRAKLSVPIHPRPPGGIGKFSFRIPDDLWASVPAPLPEEIPRGDAATIDYWSWELGVQAQGTELDLREAFPLNVLPGTPAMAAKAKAALVAADAPFTPGTDAAGKEAEGDATSAWVLVAANLVQLGGALFWHWTLNDILTLYWLETVVIGLLNLPRILLAPVDTSAEEKRGVAPGARELFKSRLFFAGFFCVHFGGFCFAFGQALLQGYAGFGARLAGLWGALAAIAASHAFTLLGDIGRQDAAANNPALQMFRPYKRLFLTFVYIFAGAGVLGGDASGQSLVLFIAVKICLDLLVHRVVAR